MPYKIKKDKLACQARYRAAHSETLRQKYRERYYNNIEKERARSRLKAKQWRLKNPEKSKTQLALAATKRRAAEYGLTLEEWFTLDARKRVENCEICGGKPSRNERGMGNRILHIDHDHKTKRFRGLLCHRCNT